LVFTPTTNKIKKRGLVMADSENKVLINVLLVEDNLADVRLTEEAFKEEKLYVELFSVLDGEAALNFLHKRNEYESVPRPDLIILDLNLPKVSGHEVLADIKKSDHLKRIPVVVLTSSQSEEDIANSYELQANCYIKKPLDLGGFMKVVKSIEQFWFTVVKLPD